jgi:hypothetical protein
MRVSITSLSSMTRMWRRARFAVVTDDGTERDGVDTGVLSCGGEIDAGAEIGVFSCGGDNEPRGGGSDSRSSGGGIERADGS